uniref:Biotin carboxyl carrier protein of acetyl-CoA carboxylase n=1 Tax=Acetithermum autotrophicum TaxID=1446466 RepID=H5STA7_ACEAU|nr:acetyl-CoA carboxylase biotin carboxyl carrier protein [Candidatus Acetothermum autotrophicum]
MDAQEIRALIEIFERSSLTELTLERGGARLTLRREGGRAPTPASTPAHPITAPSVPAQPGTTPASTATDGHVITSPLVGTFYRRPAPTEPPYVEIGDRVEKGDTVCIIEAMKVMNEIKADSAGIVEKILVEDGKPVEYGQPLMVVRPTS